MQYHCSGGIISKIIIFDIIHQSKLKKKSDTANSSTLLVFMCTNGVSLCISLHQSKFNSLFFFIAIFKWTTLQHTLPIQNSTFSLPQTVTQSTRHESQKQHFVFDRGIKKQKNVQKCPKRHNLVLLVDTNRFSFMDTYEEFHTVNDIVWLDLPFLQFCPSSCTKPLKFLLLLKTSAVPLNFVSVKRLLFSH